MPECVEMKIFQFRQFPAGSLAGGFHCCRKFKTAVRPQADKEDFCIIRWNFLCPVKAVILIIHPVLFPEFFVIIPLVQFPILETVFMLCLFCRLQNISEGITEIHNTHLFPLCL